MGTIIARGSKYRAVVRKKGITKTMTFSKKALAKAWVTDTEATIERRQVFAKGHTLGSILDRYRTEIVEPRQELYCAYEHTRPTDKTHFHLRMLAKKFGNTDLANCSTEWWVSAAREMKVAPGSRVKYLTHMSSALSTAEALWEISVDWASYKRARKTMDKLGLTGKGKKRERRLRKGELEAIKKHRRTETPQIFDDILDFAIKTGMRSQEICTLKWADLDSEEKMIWVRKRKHPKIKMINDWNVPLLDGAADIVERQPKAGNRIFPMHHQTVQKIFANSCAAAGIVDLHLHDFRHEGISRLFEHGYAIQEVALVSGHLDWRSLQIYTQLNPKSLHGGPVTMRVRHTK
jgi:integrase